MRIFKWSIALILIVLPCAPFGYPQEALTEAKRENLYSRALFVSLAEMQKTWGQIDDSDGGTRLRTDYQHVFVEKNPEITDGLPTQQGDYRVEYLDSREQMDKYKLLRKEFGILRIHPLQSDGSLLKIQVSVSYFTYQHRKFLFAVSDWSEVEFRYDCETKKFVISGIKLGGI